MTYNVSGLENASGMEALIALNQAANFYPMTIFVLIIAAVVFSLLRRDHDATESLTGTGIAMTVLTAGLALAGLLGAWLPTVSGVLVALFMLFHWKRSQPQTL